MPAAIKDKDWPSPDRYSIDENGCWIWSSGVCEDGYGKCGKRAGQTLAHRAFYTILVGPISPEKEMDHLCKNRLCVNPDHLEAVTHEENVARADYTVNHRNGRKTHCLRGHRFTKENTISCEWKGRPRRRCRTCVREKAAKDYLKKKMERVN